MSQLQCESGNGEWERIKGTTTWDATKRTAEFAADEPLPPDSRFRAICSGAAVHGMVDNSLIHDARIGFLSKPAIYSLCVRAGHAMKVPCSPFVAQQGAYHAQTSVCVCSVSTKRRW